MSILSNLLGGGTFGGSDDSTSASSNDSNFSNDFVSDIGNTIGLDLNSSQQSYSQDEDGNVSYDTNDFSLGLDSDTDSLLGSITDAFNSSDSYAEQS